MTTNLPICREGKKQKTTGKWGKAQPGKAKRYYRKVKAG